MLLRTREQLKVITFIVSQAACYYTLSINDIAASVVNRKSGQVTLCYACVTLLLVVVACQTMLLSSAELCTTPIDRSEMMCLNESILMCRHMKLD
jgi:hypothetical protein